MISAVLTYVIAIALKATMGWRITEEDEVSGIDAAEHAESGYDLGGVGASRARSVLSSTLPTTAATDTESEVRA